MTKAEPMAIVPPHSACFRRQRARTSSTAAARPRSVGVSTPCVIDRPSSGHSPRQAIREQSLGRQHKEDPYQKIPPNPLCPFLFGSRRTVYSCRLSTRAHPSQRRRYQLTRLHVRQVRLSQVDVHGNRSSAALGGVRPPKLVETALREGRRPHTVREPEPLVRW